ncbi:MAG: BatA domain-containing protein, partial [Bythopirellula sp.]
MTFVTPALLLGGALVVVPIALHLIMRRQPKHLEFPALRLVQEKSEANRRRFRLRHFLLLALRIAVIALLAFALARPSVKGTGRLGGTDAPVAASLVFDSSMRMDYRQDNQSRLDKAREMALWLVNEFPDESQIGVLTSRSFGGAFAPTRSAARQQVERLRVGAVARPLVDVVAEAIELVQESELERKEVYVLTDMVAAAWQQGNGTRLREMLTAAEDVSVYVIDVGSSEVRNVGLDELRMSSDRLSANQPLRLECELTASEPSGSRQVEMFLARGDKKPEKRRQQTVSWQEGQRARVRLELNGLEAGVYQGHVQLVGQDALAADDKRFFTVQVAEARPVLIAAQELEGSLYLEVALTSWGFECKVVD